jgi:nucleotidyltransferase substrate binding protein (TIGR01987 family)
MIDLTSFEKALSQLKRALVRANTAPEDEELRDACIQRFEYTCELAWKMLKRQLEIEIENTVEVDSFSKKQLFRVGGERGFIQDVDAWFEYLEKRNLTSHTYNEAKAQAVFAVLATFERDAVDLYNKLKARQHD